MTFEELLKKISGLQGRYDFGDTRGGALPGGPGIVPERGTWGQSKAANPPEWLRKPAGGAQTSSGISELFGSGPGGYYGSRGVVGPGPFFGGGASATTSPGMTVPPNPSPSPGSPLPLNVQRYIPGMGARKSPFDLVLQYLSGLPKDLIQLLAPLAFQAAMAEWEASDPVTILQKKLEERWLSDQFFGPREYSRVGAR